LSASAPAYAEAPRVVASIAPIHSLAAAVMQRVGEPALLVPGAASDHDYALKPSDLRKIAGADLVVWVGAPLETYLVKALATEGVRNIELLGAKRVDPHSFGAAGAPDHAQGRDGHDHAALDPHVWLDPVRAQAIVAAVAGALIDIDPENAGVYRANAEKTVADLRALDAETRAKLRPHVGKPFVTFHDGYSYFVERYGLSQMGQLTVDPVRSPGAATVSALRAKVAADSVACAFAEPQFDPGVVQVLAGETGIEMGMLDAIGADLEPGPTLYGALMRRNAEAIADCLKSTS
jgi:zinc transport system substrate-binding protein